MRGLLCGLLDESFGCGGPTLASELGQSQLSDVIQRTRVQWELFDYSNRARTVSNANQGECYSQVSALRFRNKPPICYPALLWITSGPRGARPMSPPRR